MWDSIKSFSKVQQDNIALLAMIKISSKIFQRDEQLGLKTMHSFLLVTMKGFSLQNCPSRSSKFSSRPIGALCLF